eukprot:13882726-Alexandrium_andersonii.AAC.1
MRGSLRQFAPGRPGRSPKLSSIVGPGPGGGRPSGLIRFLSCGLVSGGDLPGPRRVPLVRAPGFAEACGDSPWAGRTPKLLSTLGPGPLA